MIAEIAIFLESFGENAIELGGRCGIQTGYGNGLQLEDGVGDYAWSVARKWQTGGGHFVEDRAKREKVGAGFEILAADLFGGHVGDRADDGTWTRKGGGFTSAERGKGRSGAGRRVVLVG